MSLLTLRDVAERSDVSRRRVQAWVNSGQLRAERIGAQWLVSDDELRSFLANRGGRGRPISQHRAWAEIKSAMQSGGGGDPRRFDGLRRRWRQRARHVPVYAHPSALERLKHAPGVVVSGREAGDAAELPIGEGAKSHVYAQPSVAEELIGRLHLDVHAADPNCVLHLVEQATWPFGESERYAPLLVAWLDLADDGDRAAELVWARLPR